MYVIASFTYSAYLELAIASLEGMGIKRGNIFAVPLGKRAEKRKLFDSIYQSDGISLIDTAFILGTFFMLLGGIYGFLLKWGPVLWGIIGFFAGSALGLVIDFVPKGKRTRRNMGGNRATEVFLMINCEKAQADEVQRVLWDNLAIGIGKYEKPEPGGNYE